MKKLYFMIASICVIAGASLPVLANDAQANLAKPAKPMSGKPCQNIRAVCSQAGYVKGDLTGKAIWKDCIKPILSGKTISGVTPNPDDVKACQAKIANRAARKAANSTMHNNAPSVMPPR